MECVENISGTNMTIKDAVAMVTTAQSTLIEHADMLNESSIKLYPPTVMSAEPSTTENQCNSETIKRLNDIETALTSLQNTKQMTEDDISEIKQWRDKFVTEQSNVGIKIEKYSKKQTQNFKNLGKQIKEQDNKIEKLNQQIDSLKTKESDTDKTLEKLSLDMKEYENNLYTLNKEMRVYTDKTDQITQEILRHSDLISAIQKDTTNKFDKLLSKHVVTCKLLQQRLMPIHKIIETYNQNSETREVKMKKTETVEKEVLKLSQDLQSLEANQQVKHSTRGFLASQGRWDGKMYCGYKVITFKSVDPNTGVFTAPVDGLYKVILTIKPPGDGAVTANVMHRSGGVESQLGLVLALDKSVEASRTIEVKMKTGDVLFSATDFTDLECSHFSCSLLDV